MKGEQIKWEITTTGNKVQLLEGHVEIEELYGGFGQGQRVKLLTVRQIAKLHTKEFNNKIKVKETIKTINRNINNNLNNFIMDIDLIDLKQINDKVIFEKLKKAKIYTQAQIGNAINLYVLSFSGYCKLFNLSREKDFKVKKEIIENYFNEEDTDLYNIVAKEIIFKEELKNRLNIILNNILKTGWNINKSRIEYLMKDNHHLPKCQYYIPIHNYRIDFFWEKLKIIVEYDENKHERQLKEDSERMDKIIQYLTLQDGDCFYNDDNMLLDVYGEEPIDRNHCDYTIIRIKEDDIEGIDKVMGSVLGKLLSY